MAETSAESRVITKSDQENINGFLQPSFKKKGEVTNRPSKLKFTSPSFAKYGQPSNEMNSFIDESTLSN